MYRFNFHGIPCECETADELRAIVASNGQAQPPKAKRPYKRKAKASRNGVKASWDNAHRVAKRLGRKDVAQVRSDLKAGTIKE
ncbi:MAG: hypothetical protein IAF94_23160 [Pirellulaceae bacterium]|nr:hypothetical protein [Pirellulaceae bacterium]